MAAPNGNCSIRAINKIREHGDRLALWSFRTGGMTFVEFGKQAALMQVQVHDAGLVSGDVVIVAALPSPMLYATLVGLMGSGCTIVFIEPWMPAADIEHALEVIKPKALCADRFGVFWSLRSAGIRELRRISIEERTDLAGSDPSLQIIAVDPKQPAMISFTSGTTGRPKGVVRTHEYMWNLHEILERHSEYQSFEGPDLTIFPHLVLFNIGCGRTSLLVPKNWSLSVLQRIRELDKEMWPHTLSCGPAFLSRLIEYDLQAPSLRRIHVGGALVECELIDKVALVLPRTEVKLVYGGTEVEPVAYGDASACAEHSRKKGYRHVLNLGHPIPELKTRFDSQGILWVSGPNVCPEYVVSDADNRVNKERDSDGTLWHCMGDRILQDEFGFWYAGRSVQPYDDFLFEQKLYSKLGHTRAFVHRDRLNNRILIADDESAHVSRVASEIDASPTVVWTSLLRRDRRHRARIDRTATWRVSLRMQRWRIYLKERSPIALLLVLALGPVVSGFFLSQVHGLCAELPRGTCLQSAPSIGLAVLAIVASLLFMILARMMDEMKDYNKDLDANPSRPLPRGLIDPSEMKTGIVVVFGVLLFSSLLMLFLPAYLAAGLLLSAVIYLWLMYREFYVGHWLADYPFAYALSHQLVAVPLYLFGVTLFAPAFAAEPLAWTYVGVNVTASVSYEFARKLKPDAHPAARTYRQIYGLRISALIAFVFQAVSLLLAVNAQREGFVGLSLLILVQTIALTLFMVVAGSDKLHKHCEGVAALVVLLSAWMGLFVFFRF